MNDVLRHKVVVGGSLNVDLKTLVAVARYGASVALDEKSRASMNDGNAFFSSKVESREPLFEIYTPLTLDVSAVPAGDYVLKYTFNDVNSRKSSSIEQRFKLK